MSDDRIYITGSGEDPKKEEPGEAKVETISLQVGAEAIAALAALGVSAYDTEGKEKDVGTLITEIKSAVQLDK